MKVRGLFGSPTSFLPTSVIRAANSLGAGELPSRAPAVAHPFPPEKPSGNQVAEKQHGGPRPNSGRPPKEITELRREMQAAFIKRGKSRLNAIIDKTLDLAESGDSAARGDVFKYLMGQPTQPIEMTGEQRLVIEYVNDWRGQDRLALPPPGPAGSAAAGPPLQLGGGGPTLAQDDADDVRGG